MKIEVRISGLGGQGVVLTGQILGRAATYDGRFVVQTQSYGAEARGSAAKSEVIISDERIGFPMVRKCDVLIALSQEAVDGNINCLTGNGILFVDSSMITRLPETEAKVFNIPATRTAGSLFGDKLYANMIILGALTKATDLVSEESILNAIRHSAIGRSTHVNLQAFLKGKDLV